MKKIGNNMEVPKNLTAKSVATSILDWVAGPETIRVASPNYPTELIEKLVTRVHKEAYREGYHKGFLETIDALDKIKKYNEEFRKTTTEYE